MKGYNQIIKLKGIYSGKSIYVQHHFPPSDVGFYGNADGFCINKVKVNGSKLKKEYLGSAAFEIDFDEFNIKKGNEVLIKIYHDKGCTPKILNEEVLLKN